MANEEVVQLTDANFRQEVLEAGSPVLVDFWAPWCAPCRMVAPVIDQIASEYRGRVKVGKVNVDENPETAMAYRIQSIPTLAVFAGGRVVDGVRGAVPKDRLVEMLERQLAGTPS